MRHIADVSRISLKQHFIASTNKVVIAAAMVRGVIAAAVLLFICKLQCCGLCGEQIEVCSVVSNGGLFEDTLYLDCIWEFGTIAVCASAQEDGAPYWRQVSRLFIFVFPPRDRIYAE